MGKGGRILERIAERAELPGEGIPGQSFVELLGDNRVLIEGHRGVRGYSADKITVKVPFGLICISGYGLELTHMTAQQLIIRGRIDGIILQRRK